MLHGHCIIWRHSLLHLENQCEQESNAGSSLNAISAFRFKYSFPADRQCLLLLLFLECKDRYVLWWHMIDIIYLPLFQSDVLNKLIHDRRLMRIQQVFIAEPYFLSY